eukprot:scaffold1944_cov241-Pinguiococcus_pyrenoidosus.AAC.22
MQDAHSFPRVPSRCAQRPAQSFGHAGHVSSFFLRAPCRVLLHASNAVAHEGQKHQGQGDPEVGERRVDHWLGHHRAGRLVGLSARRLESKRAPRCPYGCAKAVSEAPCGQKRRKH